MSKSPIVFLSLSAFAALTSCVAISQREPGPGAPVEDVSAAALRERHDLARGRRWELGWGAVAAYDAVTNRPIRRVVLEGATLTAARGSCPPDMLLDRTGALLVSSNTQPVLWRVSPERYEVERFEVRLEDESGRDVGFGGLEWAPDGRTLHALDASTGSTWRIDFASLQARRIGTAARAPRAC